MHVLCNPLGYPMTQVRRRIGIKIEMFVAREDRRAGTGANFVVEWAADGPISEPVIEAVMIGTQGNATYLFVSPGRPERIVQPD